MPFGNTPLARVVLAVRAGTIDEDADAPGIADVVAEMLQQGTASRSAGEIARAVSGMGAFFGALEATVSATETQLGATVLAEFAPELVRLVADVATRPALPADALARIATNRRRTLAAQRANPPELPRPRWPPCCTPTTRTAALPRTARSPRTPSSACGASMASTSPPHARTSTSPG